MSQETTIGNLNGGISDEDSRLVDSILNDLNSSGGQQQGQPGQTQQGQQVQMQQPHMQGQMQPGQQPGQQQPGQQQGQPGPRQEVSPEQMKNIQMQRQMALQQQQQIMHQQQMAQQMAQNQGKNEIPVVNDSLLENIKKESKSIILIMLLFIVLNLPQIDNLFKSYPNLFVCDSGVINMQAILVKSIIIGGVFYGVKTYLL